MTIKSPGEFLCTSFHDYINRLLPNNNSSSSNSNSITITTTTIIIIIENIYRIRKYMERGIEVEKASIYKHWSQDGGLIYIKFKSTLGTMSNSH